jgi:hypothetical protein
VSGVILTRTLAELYVLAIETIVVVTPVVTEVLLVSIEATPPIVVDPIPKASPLRL